MGDKEKMENPVTHYHQTAIPDSQIKDRFYRYFQQECTELQEQIVRLENYSFIGGEKQDAIDHVLSGISRLANDVSDSSSFVPAYDQRIYAQVNLPTFNVRFTLTISGYQSSRGETARGQGQVCTQVKVSIQE